MVWSIAPERCTPTTAPRPDGTELTLSTAVLAPFRLSLLLSPLLFATPPSVIVTVSSGGMYTQRFDLNDLELTRDGYRGVTAYARAKRAQVVLAHEWDRRWRHEGVASYAMHPGWVTNAGAHRKPADHGPPRATATDAHRRR
jgi:dehydrogenase/reductase SDR family protein 12